MTSTADSRTPGEPFVAAGLGGVFWDPSTTPFFDDRLGCWNVFSYADVDRLVHETVGFSRYRGDPKLHPTYAGMWNFDDPRHADLRATARDPFRRSELEDLSAQITAIAHDLIDAAIAADARHVELVEAFASRLPNRVICLILGVEQDQENRVRQWLAEIGAAVSVGRMPDQPDLVAYLNELLDGCRRGGSGGLTADLIRAQRAGHQVAGEPLSDEDLVGYLATLLMAGSHTTAAGIANAVLYLDEYVGLDALRQDPAKTGTAIEETLRWCPPFPAIRVRATGDVAFSGVDIGKGDWVSGWVTSANRDPARFTDPDQFDVSRSPNPHLAFGGGPYHCLGAPLARLELRIGVTTLLKRTRRIARDRRAPLRRTPGMVYRLDELHCVLTPR